jgi:hypothetical protein
MQATDSRSNRSPYWPVMILVFGLMTCVLAPVAWYTLDVIWLRYHSQSEVRFVDPKAEQKKQQEERNEW